MSKEGGAEQAPSPAPARPPLNSSRSGRMGVAGKIAAFASGVAPVQRTDDVLSDEEQDQTVEELLHKLEAATRTSQAGSGSVALPLRMVLTVVEKFGGLSLEAARLTKELEQAKNNSSQGLLMPSAWVKREHKYKQDLETFERTIASQAERIAQLEGELVRQREGANIRPLEDKVKELESQLQATAQEKTQALSKFHELSIKHRQMIETSPHVSAVWREVLVQQSNGKDAAAVSRLTNFDLRHTNGTTLSPSLPEPPTADSQQQPETVAGLAALHAGRAAGFGAQWSRQASQLVQLGGLAADAAAQQPQQELHDTSSGPAVPGAAGAIEQAAATAGGAVPMSAASSSAAVGAADGVPAGAGADGAAAAAAGASNAADASASGRPQVVSAESQAHALIARIAAEQASPEAAVAALQQLNYDLTMQLGLYQQMVLRLKDAMERSDVEKAELEASQAALEMQLEQAQQKQQQRQAGQQGAVHAGLQLGRAGSLAARSNSSRSGWSGWWRSRSKAGGPGVAASDAVGAASDDDTESVSSAGVRESLATLSVQSSLDSNALFAATAALDGDGELPAAPSSATPRSLVASPRPSADGTEAAARSADDTAAALDRASTTAAPAAGTGAAAEGAGAAPAAGTSSSTAAGQAAAAPGAAASDAAAAMAAAKAKARERRAAASAKAAEDRETLAREAKEAWRKAQGLSEENAFLVKSLVEIKMELADMQGAVLQHKRALARAMDDKVVMETKVAELQNMLNMAMALPASSTHGTEPPTSPLGASSNTDEATMSWAPAEWPAAKEQRQQHSSSDSSSTNGSSNNRGSRDGTGSSAGSPPGTPSSAGRGVAAAVASGSAVATESLDGHALSDHEHDGTTSGGEFDEPMRVESLAAGLGEAAAQVAAQCAAGQADAEPASGVNDAGAAGTGRGREETAAEAARAMAAPAPHGDVASDGQA